METAFAVLERTMIAKYAKLSFGLATRGWMLLGHLHLRSKDGGRYEQQVKTSDVKGDYRSDWYRCWGVGMIFELSERTLDKPLVLAFWGLLHA